MWELDYKESWALKNWYFWTVVLEKTLESPLDCEEIHPVHLKGDQSWVFIGRTNAKAESPILWSLDSKNLLIWKDPDAGKDWRQEEKRMIEDETVGWHHWFNGHGFEQALVVGDAIQPSHPLPSPSLPAFNYSQPQGLFKWMSQFFTSGGQSIGISSSASVLPINIQDWFPLGLTGWIYLQSKGLWRVFSNTTVQKYQFFSAQLSL